MKFVIILSWLVIAFLWAILKMVIVLQRKIYFETRVCRGLILTAMQYTNQVKTG